MEFDEIVNFDESKLRNDFRTPPSVGGDDEWSLNNAPESVRSGRCMKLRWPEKQYSIGL